MCKVFDKYENDYEVSNGEKEVPMPHNVTPTNQLDKKLSNFSHSLFDDYTIEDEACSSKIEVPLQNPPPLPDKLSKPLGFQSKPLIPNPLSKPSSISCADLSKIPKEQLPSIAAIANVFLQLR